LRALDVISRNTARFRATDHGFVLFMAVMIGLLGGGAAIIIQEMILFFKESFYGDGNYTIEYLQSLPLYVRIGAPVLGSLIVGLIIHFFSSEAKGHGVPEVMQAIAIRDGIIRPRVALSKLFASSVYIGAGGSVGREGPVIQIGAALGSSLGQLFRVNPDRLKLFVACGAASGIAAAFNAPIAGTLFAVEVLLGDFAVARFTPIVISSVVSTVVSQSYLGNHTAFVVPGYQLVSPWELIPYTFLGVAAGLVGILYIKTLYGLEDFFDNWKLNIIPKIMLGGLIIGVMSLWLPEVLGVGYETMSKALLGELTWQLMIILVFAKMLATSVSLASGGSGGVFAPSLFLGTMIGGFVGALTEQFWPGISAGPGAYALVGMAAMVAGTTHAPITAILIIFEMTHDYKIILPLMIAATIATLITTRLHKESIYTLKLVRKGIKLFHGREVNLLKSLSVAQVMNPNVVTIPPQMNLKAIFDLMHQTHHDYFYMVDDASAFLGVLTSRDIRSAMGAEEASANLIIAMDMANQSLPVVHTGDSLDAVMKVFGKVEMEELPVVEQETGNLLGTISRQHAIDAYNNELSRRNTGDEVSASIQMLDRMDTVSFSNEYVLSEIHLPKSLVNKTIKSAKIRQKYDVQIILIKRPAREREQERQFSPKGDDRFLAGDHLIVLGPPKEINRLKTAG
jgi:CIC family chloride channel protein